MIDINTASAVEIDTVEQLKGPSRATIMAVLAMARLETDQRFLSRGEAN